MTCAKDGSPLWAKIIQTRRRKRLVYRCTKCKMDHIYPAIYPGDGGYPHDPYPCDPFGRSVA